MTFQDFLLQRIELDVAPTDDVLAGFLPLAREVIEAHRAGCVAPLDALHELHVDDGRVWFEVAKRLPIRRNATELQRLEAASRVAVEVLSESRRTTDVSDGHEEVTSAEIGVRGERLERPVYLPGYVAWEHEVQHHDPLTDVFSLGLLLASLACRLNLSEPDDLARFVASRRNLFALNEQLHPALAQAILRMTELDRHRRPQDLPALVASLENYRDQSIEFSLDLARLPGLQTRDVRTKTDAVLARLRDRLFDLTRRNTLLHFRPTLGSLNLTQASLPLMLDIRHIRDDQVLIWSDSLRQQLTSGKPISLNKHLNFAEAVYLPSLLERILADARRDQQEFGFAQLRLVVCFLSWANLKVKPAEAWYSPLVLLPVRLTKSKGIRDTFSLEPLSTEAEINPVLRHQFRQLYGIDLPESLDLSVGGLDSLFELLQARIQASEPAVTIHRVDRPRIDLLHEKAKRRLDQYRRSSRVAGRGVRCFMNLDYSYDPANYHPLGIKLFTAKVRTPTTRLREIIEERPRPRSFIAPDPSADVPSADASSVDIAEKERTFFQLRDATESNPYLWNFDLCSLTLANFHYRRMSLVRDYESLLRDRVPNPAFEATFSLAPRPAGRDLPPTPPLAERFDVVSCDPTQATAIAEARGGGNYIIQGPPGTGKSQTITNLIADFVARGQRVLFVCEKRAAIDVVFARLRQCGLGSLCCLIHDSQTDKKEFVLDLKQTYEELLDADKAVDKADAKRDDVVAQLQKSLTPLEQFDAAMMGHPMTGHPSLAARRLLDRCLRLRDDRPEVSPEEAERLPPYGDWFEHRETLAGLEPIVRDLEPTGVWARHPLRLLSPRVADSERPMEFVGQSAKQALALLDRVLAGPALLPVANGESKEQATDKSARPTTIAVLTTLLDYARRFEAWARQENLSLFDPRRKRAKLFASELRRLEAAEQDLQLARQATTHWRPNAKLSAADAQAAFDLAQRSEQRWFAFLSPSWWRLRGVLNRSYDFTAHTIRPTWSVVLGALVKEHVAQAARDRVAQQTTAEFRLDGEPVAAAEKLTELRSWLAAAPPWLRELHEELVKAENSDDDGRVEALFDRWLGVEETAQQLVAELDRFAADYVDLPLDTLRETLVRIGAATRQVPRALTLLGELGRVPVGIGRTLRERPWTLVQTEAAIAAHTWSEFCRTNRDVERFDGRSRAKHVARLESLHDGWLAANANEIRRRVKERFLANVRLSSLPASQLAADERDRKKTYSQGRRTLEHEFGKTMRYRSIRELVDGESGLVVRDLKPVWLMSPLSVSDTLPLSDGFFDVVIFDEASQVPLEEAVPSLFRGRQVIVVGDEMQLPPTTFFATKQAEDDEELLVEEGEQRVRFDLSSDSFLNHAAKNLPATMLGWHYRSRSESLISFSNWAFYDGRLLTVPEEQLPTDDTGVARTLPPAHEAGTDKSAGATAPLDLLLSRPLSFHLPPGAVYDKRRNRGEAEYIAGLVRELLVRRAGLSLGVIAFSEAQQDEIESALARLAQDDDEFRALYEEELQREVDGQFVGLLVKNLENIQGDERDVILLSVCYGPGPTGKMLMSFGPINQSGGEKRLNVAFSRAKRHMAVISSIRSTAITNEYNEGANCLKNYLRYAESISRGDVAEARRVLTTLSRWHDDVAADRPRESDAVAEQLATVLRERGWLVDESVGQSHFRVDLAIRRPGDTVYRLGILIDTFAGYEQSDPLERDMLRPRLLRDFGWRVTSVLAKDWYYDRDAELRQIETLTSEPP